MLFTWDELEEIFKEKEGDTIEFRIVGSQCAVRPGLKTAVPYDYLDMSPGSGWDQFLRRTRSCRGRQNLQNPELEDFPTSNVQGQF